MINVMVSTRNLTKNEWLEFRKNGIGGSDVAVICGISKYKSPLKLWMEKIGQIEPEEAGEAAYWGNVMEPIIRKEFTKRTGLKVDVINSILRHREHEFMIANIDGYVIDVDKNKCIFEAKTASAYMAEKWEDDKIPDGYMLQIQHYMAVTGFGNAYIAALIGGNRFVYKKIARDDELIDLIVQLEYDFWECVINNIPPEIDCSDACTDLMSRLYPSSNSNSILMSDEAMELITQFNSSKEQEKYYSELKDEAANKLKAMLGNNESGKIGDYTITWKNVVSERLDTKLFKAELPDVYEKYTKESTLRRFIIK